MELNGMNWDDIWSFDGELQQLKQSVLIRMNDIPLIIKELLFYQSSIKIDVKNASKDFEEISEKQKSMRQEINEKYLEKFKLKYEKDKAILNYTKCVEQYNNLRSKERDILIEKQKKEQKLSIINKDY
ncbi:chromosome segregation protein, partial [Reticulomyxa filosa]